MRQKLFIPLLWEPALDELTLQGEPVWKYTLKRFADFDLFLDTNSERVLGQVHEDPQLAHVSPYLRDPGLRDPLVPVNDLIVAFLRRYRIHHDVVGQIHANRPFLKPGTVAAAFDKIEVDGPVDAVVGANHFQARLWAEDEHGYYPVNHNPVDLRRSSTLPLYWAENSTFYVFHSEAVHSIGNRVSRRPLFVDTAPLEDFVIQASDDMERLLTLKQTLDVL